MTRVRLLALATALLLVAGVAAAVTHDSGGDGTSVETVGPAEDTDDDILPDLSLPTTTPTGPALPSVTVTALPLPKATVPTTASGPAAGTPASSDCAGSRGPAVDAPGLWLVDMATGTLRRALPETVDSPSWSPDGTRLAWVSRDTGETGGVRRIGVVDAASGQSKVVFEGRVGVPRWTPDGRTLVFPVQGEGTSQAVATVPADGGAHRVVYEATGVIGGLEVSARSRIGVTDGGDLHVMDLDGKNRTTLTRTTANVHNLLFSPDGGRVAYTDTQLVIQDVATKDEARFSSTKSPGFPLEWADDGSRAAFVRVDDAGHLKGIAARHDGAYPREVPGRGGVTLSPAGDRLAWADDAGAGAKLTVTDVATGAERVVATGLWQPVWSTNGEGVAALGLVPGTTSNYVCVVDGDRQRRVADLPTHPPYGRFQWSPSGTTLAFVTF